MADQVTTESDLERQLYIGVNALGGIPYKWTSPGRRGVPDRILMFPGRRVYFVEMKAPGEVPDPSQRREHDRIMLMGHTVRVLDSADDVSSFLLEVERAMFKPKWKE